MTTRADLPPAPIVPVRRPAGIRFVEHTHRPSQAPLIVRLRDLAPHLSHEARALLALQRMYAHVDQVDAAQASLAAAADTMRALGLRP